MKSVLRKLVVMLTVAMLAVTTVSFVTGCEDQGPAEQAGEQADEGMEEAQDTAEEAGDEAEDTAEDAGQAVEDAMQ